MQRLAVDLAAVQRARGNDATLVWTGRATRAATACERAGVPFLVADGLLPLRSRRLALFVGRPDIVHLHMAPPWVGTVLPRRTAIVMHLHGRPAASATTATGWLSAALEHVTLARTDVLVAISHWVEAAWQARHPNGHYVTVYNGINVPQAPPVPGAWDLGRSPIVGMGSRLAADKGAYEFVDFAFALHRIVPAARFVVAGDGPERAALEAKAAPLVTAGVFAFRGFVEEMGAFWSSLDLAMFGGKNDAFGLGLIEPLVHGVPVLAYSTGAGSDEVVNSCRGIDAVPYGDSDALARRAAALLADPSLRRRMAEDGFADIAACFTLERMADGIEAAYAEALVRSTRRTP